MSADINLDFHWIYLLDGNHDHPLWQIIEDHDPKGRELCDCSHLYLGYLQDDAKADIKIAILHYNSNYDPNLMFKDIQNIMTYTKIQGLNDKDIEYLALNVVKDLCIDLKNPNSLTEFHLEFMKDCQIFAVVNEKKLVKEYGVVYKEMSQKYNMKRDDK